MDILYVDTSALVKRYVKELGYSWMRKATGARANNRIFLSELGTLELEVAFTRKMLETSITPTDRDAMVRQFQRHLRGRYDTMPVHDELLTRARRLVRQAGLPHPLRTYDAIHLATALELRDRLQRLGLAAPIFVTADRKLLAIAEHLGLATENPEDHP